MDLNTIKSSISLSSLGSSLNLSIKSHGKSACPLPGCGSSDAFHVRNDKTYKCYRCQRQGDIFQFLIDLGLCSDFKSSVHTLSQQVSPTGNLSIPYKQHHQRVTCYELAFDIYKEELKKNKEKVAEYFESRGWEFNDSLDIGYAPAKGSLLQKLEVYDLSQSDLINPHTGTKKGTSSDFIECQLDRVIFPVRDPRGRIIHFCGRSLDPNESLRWKSTAGQTPNISSCLYGINEAADHKDQRLYICEGISDRLSLKQLGLRAVSTFGVSGDFSIQAHNFSNVKEIYSIFDSDTYPLGHPKAGTYKSWDSVLPALIDFTVEIRKHLDSSTPHYCVLLPPLSGIKDINELLVFQEYVIEEFNQVVRDNQVTLERLATDILYKSVHQHPRLWKLMKSSESEHFYEFKDLIVEREESWEDYVFSLIEELRL